MSGLLAAMRSRPSRLSAARACERRSVLTALLFYCNVIIITYIVCVIL